MEDVKLTVSVPKIVKQKPIISWWKSGDPCYKIDILRSKLTDVNIINTKHLSDEFVQFCIEQKHRLFLHVNINGMGRTQFEPNIPTVKETFLQLKKLIDSGFSQKQILVFVNPILPNENGLKALKLLLRVFTEFKPLRLRYVRFQLLTYKQILKEGKNTYVISNQNIGKRPEVKRLSNYLFNDYGFFKDYSNLLNEYQSIITIDKGDEYLIGIRELLPFGLKNEWIEFDGTRTKLIFYEKNNRFRPMLNIISDSKPTRCKNRCILCPHLF